MATPPASAHAVPRRRDSRRAPGGHVHWFRRTGDDPFSGASLYTCRCGTVRSGF